MGQTQPPRIVRLMPRTQDQEGASHHMTDEDRAALADLAMRSLDTILEDYGDDAHLCAASLVFEVQVGQGDEALYHVNYKSLERNSPHHVAGLLHSTAAHITNPDDDQ